jgi:hypothetical protein
MITSSSGGPTDQHSKGDHEIMKNREGYEYGQSSVARSPVSLEELRQIEMSAGWSDDDARVLGHWREIFETHAEEMVDAWRAVIGAQPHLAKWFFGPDGKPDDAYKRR